MNLLVCLPSLILSLSIIIFIVSQARACKGNASGEKDYLLILGCRVREYTAEETLTLRCRRACQYLRQHPHTVAIACGGIVHKDQYISEAQAIRDLLISEGIEEERIILEDKSTTTVENFANAKRLMRATDNIALLSSDFHLLRSRLIAKRAGLLCQTVSAPSPKKELVKNYIREYFAFILFIFGGK